MATITITLSNGRPRIVLASGQLESLPPDNYRLREIVSGDRTANHGTIQIESDDTRFTSHTFQSIDLRDGTENAEGGTGPFASIADAMDHLETVFAVTSSGGGATTLNGLTDVTITSASNGQVLKYNGSAWVNGTDTGGGNLSATDIDTLAELNAILTDATLIDTTDSRLSDARTPTSHTHPASEISDSTSAGRALLTAADAAAQRTLLNVENGATADQSDAEIETAYNNQVPQVSGAEITAGTATGIRRYAPADIKSFIDQHAGGGGDLSATDIDTLAELNAILTDATLIDTTDSRLSDARTPTSHTHTASEISDSTTAGRALLTATDVAAQQTALNVEDGADVTSATNVGVAIGDASEKTTLVAADVFTILDSESSGVLSTVPKSVLDDYISPIHCIPIAVSDDGPAATDLTTGTAKVTFRMPYAFTLTSLPRASVTVAPTGGTLLTVDINEGGTSILSTKITFDAGEKTSTTAATPAVLSDTSLADDAEITIDIDAVGSTVAGKGLKVYLIGRRTVA